LEIQGKSITGAPEVKVGNGAGIDEGKQPQVLCNGQSGFTMA